MTMTNKLAFMAAGFALAIFARVAIASAMPDNSIDAYSLLDGLLFTLSMAGFSYTYYVDRNACKKQDIIEELHYIRSKVDKLYEHFLPEDKR